MKKLQLASFAVLLAAQVSAQKVADQHAIVIDSPIPGLSGLRAATDTLVPPGLSASLSLLGVREEDGGGYVFGTNGYGDAEKGQEFVITGTVAVEGLMTLVALKAGTGSVLFKLVDGDGVLLDDEGEPTNVIAPETELGAVSKNMTELDTTGWTTAYFANPISVTGRFYLTVDYSEIAAGFPAKQLAFASSAANATGTTNTGAWEVYEGEWWPMAATWSARYTMAMLAIIDANATSVGSNDRLNGMQMSFIGGNPASNNVQLAYDFERSAQAHLRIMDITGATVLDKNLGRAAQGEHRMDLNVSNWANGTYFVTLFADGKPLTKKLVVQH